MERSHGSDKRVACKEAVCSLLLGLFFCLLLAALCYFTIQNIRGNMTFCTLWIDVPGRFMIFVTCYFIASECGFLPLPKRCRLNRFIQPFHVWRLHSWRRLFRNILLSFRSRRLIVRYQRNAISAEESFGTPLLQENDQEHNYGCPQRRPTSRPITVPYPQSYVAPVFVSSPEMTPRDESQVDRLVSDGSISSIDSSVSDIAVPRMKSKRSMPSYLSEAGVEEYESSEDEDKVSSKYRKRYTEPKWPGESITNALVPVPDNRTAVRARSGMVTLDKKSKTLADNEQRVVSREQRSATEMFKGHSTKKLVPVSTHTFSCDTSKKSIDKKCVTLTEGERLVSTLYQGKPKPVSEIPTAHAVDSLQTFKIKSPPKYRERSPEVKQKSKWTEKKANVLAPMLDDQSFAPTTKGRTLNKKDFEITDNERLPSTQQHELQRSGNGKSKLRTADNGHKEAARNNLLTEMNDQQRIHQRHLQSGGETSKYKQETLPKYCNTKAHNFPGTQNRNQQSSGACASSKLGDPEKSHDIDTSWNFPRFPWKNLRNPMGVSALANKLHKKNLELEKRQTENILIEYRKHDRIDEWIRSLLGSLRSNRVTEPQLQRSSENNPKTRSSSRIESFSTAAAECSSKQTEIRTTTGSNLSKSNTNLTNNRYGAIQGKEGDINPDPAIEQNCPVFSERTQLESPTGHRATHRRRRLPSQRFPVRPRTRTQILNKTGEETEFKLEIHKHVKKDSAQKPQHEAGPSNFSRFYEEQPGTLRPVTETDESLEYLKGRLEPIEQGRTRAGTGDFGVARSKENTDTNTRHETTAACEKDVTESNVSTKPSEVDAEEKPDVIIQIDPPLNSSDDDKDPEQSGK